MKRVLVIGSGGSGKSTFAVRLGALVNLPVVHLDAVHWRPGWTEPPKDEWVRIVEGLVAEESWVIDGNFSGTLELRAARADTIIVLDLPRRVCLWRVGKRVVTYWGRRRPDMAEGCPEHLDLKFLAWIWNYRAHTRPRVVARLEDSAASKTIVWLRSAREVEAYLASHEPVRAGR